MGYIHFAILGDESFWAAEASECADDQGKFWEYHDYLFTHQNGENQGAFSKENLKSFASALGLDTAAFNACLDSGKYTLYIQQQTQFSGSLGVQNTPSFLVGNQGLVGAQPFSQFQGIIESLLGQ